MIKQELTHLFKNKLLLFVMIVILLIPAIYAGMFLNSMWDPYGEISRLPVAVVNKNVPVEYNGKTLAVGDNLQTSLKDNNAMDFNITDEKNAQEGLKNGDYYMVITIPQDFSKNASSMMDKNPQKMQLQYATNPGYNYISSKLSESAIKEIKANIISEVTTTYTRAVFASITELGDGLIQVSDGTEKLLDGMNSLNDGAGLISDNLNVMTESGRTLQNGSQKLLNGVTGYVDGVGQLDNGINALSDGIIKVSDGTGQLQAGSNALSLGINLMKKQIDNSLTTENVAQINMASGSLLVLNDNIQKLNTAVKGIDTTKISLAGEAAGADLQKAGNALNGAAAELVGKYAVTGNAADLSGGAKNVINAYSILAGLYQSQNLTDEQRIQIAQAMSYLYDSNNQSETAYNNIVNATGGIKEAGKNVQNAGNTLTGLAQSDMSGQVITLQTSVAQMAAASDQLLPASSKAMDSLLSGMQNVQAGLGNTEAENGQMGIIEGMTNLDNGIKSLNAGVRGTDGMLSGISRLQAGSQQLVDKGAELKDGMAQVTDGTSKIADGAAALANGSKDLQSGITAVTDGISVLNTSLNAGADKISQNKVNDSNVDMFVNPLTVEETQITTVENNGHAMAAYMMSVGLWVGCLAFCLMYPLVKYHDKLKNGFTWFMSKAIILYPTAIIMALVLYFSLHVIDGFNPVQTGNTILVTIVTAVCFMTIMYFFNALLGKVGSFIMLVFMVLQLAGSAGTYPIEISGTFAEAIHKYVPFTYTVNAFRSAISGGAGIHNELTVLAVLTVIFMILTVLLFWYRAKRINAGKPVFYSWIQEHGLA